ncbi:MAG: hypothetical protein LBT30_07310 [Clostridiales bacterium]|nr:hypothetical protein [Clostridiales bacterium]
MYEVREYCICKDVCRAEYEENFQTHCSGRKILSETEFREFEKRGGGEIKYDYGNDRFDDLQYVGCGKCRAGDTLQYSGCGCKNF